MRRRLLALRLKLWRQNARNLYRRLSRNKPAMAGFILVLVFVAAAILAPVITRHPPDRQNLADRFSPPSLKGKYLLGADHLGRDVFSRIIYGARVSILVGVITVTISMLVGGTLGILAGYYGGVLDAALSRFSEILLAFPYLIFAIGAMAMMGPGFWNLIWALCFKGWVEFFRLARAGVMAEKTREYVDAARVLGRSDAAIMLSEILPNMINPLIVVGTLRMGTMMVMEASLSFLGIGIPPRIPAWGSMIQDGYRFILNAWWLSALPGLFLVTLVLSVNIFGEALREALNPDLKTF
ncbi:MAG TPA: ABC transporter permease [Firmicutes bacterium]|nr:ABC transporter permease [Candidatus Fermentithermobacillaceae bacterium]